MSHIFKAAFNDRCEEVGLKILRIVNVHDAVPKVPGILFNENFHVMKKWVDKLPWSYYHVGVELALDHNHSPFLKSTNNISSFRNLTHNLSCFHNLEAYLHLLDGYHGPGQHFHLSSPRDHALVNKSCDFLRERYQVPSSWWQAANKGLIKNSEGRWVQPERNRIIKEHHETSVHNSRPDQICGVNRDSA